MSAVMSADTYRQMEYIKALAEGGSSAGNASPLLRQATGGGGAPGPPGTPPIPPRRDRGPGGAEVLGQEHQRPDELAGTGTPGHGHGHGRGEVGCDHASERAEAEPTQPRRGSSPERNRVVKSSRSPARTLEELQLQKLLHQARAYPVCPNRGASQDVYARAVTCAA